MVALKEYLETTMPILQHYKLYVLRPLRLYHVDSKYINGEQWRFTNFRSPSLTSSTNRAGLTLRGALRHDVVWGTSFSFSEPDP